MKNKSLYLYCLVVLLVGCQPNLASHNISVPETQVNDEGTISTQISPTSESEGNPAIIFNPTTPPITLKKLSTDDSLEPKLVNKCLKEISVPPAYDSIIAFRSFENVIPGQYPDIVLIDLSEDLPKQKIQRTNITSNFSVSHNGELIAYVASTLVNGVVAQVELAVANGNFQVQNSIPYKDHWYSVLGWTADQRVIISSKTEETLPSSVFLVLVDPKNGSEEAVNFSVSDFIDATQYAVPYWDGWYGIVNDPTQSWAVYIKQSNISTEAYTYGLWDISTNKPVFSLDTIFSGALYFTKASPKPAWSLDGKQFALVGGRTDEEPGKFELFSINVNGDMKQLTNLSNIGYIWSSTQSWSPKNDHIAFFVSPPQSGEADDANVVIVNTKTLDVIDLCLSVGIHDSAPVWSPNGKQFLVVDEYEEGHQRVLLIDIEKHIVFPIAENVEPIAWMTKP